MISAMGANSDWLEMWSYIIKLKFVFVFRRGYEVTFGNESPIQGRQGLPFLCSPIFNNQMGCALVCASLQVYCPMMNQQVYNTGSQNENSSQNKANLLTVHAYEESKLINVRSRGLGLLGRVGQKEEFQETTERGPCHKSAWRTK